MKSVGVYCPLTLEGRSNNERLALALNTPKSDRPTIKKFRQDLARSQMPKMFISAEAFHNLTDRGLARLKRLVGDRRIHILFYVRDYPAWVPSMYAQSTKKGSNLHDFDAFVTRGRKKLSVVARLEKWANAFGWESMYIRPLDGAALFGGELVSDVLHTLGIAAPPPPIGRKNESPHWITLEVIRELASRVAPNRKLDNRSVWFIGRVVEETVADQPRRIRYVSRAQWRELADIYAADLTLLGQRTGQRFSAALVPPEEERPFLPRFDAIPRGIRERILVELNDRNLSARIDPAVAAILLEMLGER